MNLFCFATAWGPRFGGVNAFNRDFAVGLAQELGSGGKVFCAVIEPHDGEVADAQSNGVEVVAIRNKPDRSTFEITWIQEVLTSLACQAKDEHIDYWIGHDIISGSAALRAAEISGGSAALIHHMSYVSYQSYKSGDSIGADSRFFQQRHLFNENAQLFAVGPLLQRACRDLTGRPVTQLIPGFPNIPPSRSPNDSIVAVTFGRLDKASDRVKQGRLAVAAFANAVKQSRAAGNRLKCFSRPTLHFVGLESDSKQEEIAIQELADHYGGRVINVIALPFDHDRHRLFQRLGGANLAMMLSWHEGFGLTGWEAIAAEIPLIITEHSGLHELIVNTLRGPGRGCIRSVDVRGHRGSVGEENFAPEDLEIVSNHILDIGADLEEHKENACSLKEMLISKIGCTWRHTARQFLEAARGHPPQIEGNDTHKRPGTSWTAPTRAVSVHNWKLGIDAKLAIQVPTQNLIGASFPLCAQAEFQKAEIMAEGQRLTFGLQQATLRTNFDGCRIAPGGRLGDNQNPLDGVSALAGNAWTIRSSKGEPYLAGAYLGTNPLCLIEILSVTEARFTLVLFCEVSHLMIGSTDIDVRATPPNKLRILRTAMAKWLNAEDGIIFLARITTTIKDRAVIAAGKSTNVTFTKDQISILQSVLKSSSDLETLVQICGLDPTRDFRGADLTGVDFATLDLRGFDLTRADLRGSDLHRAKIDGAIFTDVITSGDEGLPESQLMQKPLHGPFHRLLSPMQTVRTAEQQKQTGMILGPPARRSSFSNVKAYRGPLPSNTQGIEFITNVEPSDKHSTPFEARWYEGQLGVSVVQNNSHKYASIPVIVTKMSYEEIADSG